MFLNEEFLKLWEELNELNEAKADTQNLINFAGEDLANRFLAIKNKLKAPENDLYYWIKNKTPEELESFLANIESTKSKTQVKKDLADQGAELVCDSKHWKVYRITTFEASQKYGRDTKWCITGVNNWGDKYWNEYRKNGIEFYFLITKGEYDPRGTDSKIAIALYKNTLSCEVFNQQDTPIPLAKVPYLDEIKLPGIDMANLQNGIECFECGSIIENEEDIMYGPHEECYCKNCFDILYFRCKKCHEFHFTSLGFYEDAQENRYCIKCHSNRELLANSPDTGILYNFDAINSDKPYKHFVGIATTSKQAKEKFANIIYNLLQDVWSATKIEIFDLTTGELLYVTDGITENTLTELNDIIDHCDLK